MNFNFNCVVFSSHSEMDSNNYLSEEEAEDSFMNVRKIKLFKMTDKNISMKKRNEKT